jgi:phosphohistidine phosphatase SixA
MRVPALDRRASALSPALSHREKPMIRRRSLLAACLALAAAPAAAASPWDALGRPGTHAIMRHALAPGTGDPPAFRIGDCATQRNLDARGRAQARAIGAAIREAGVSFDRVLTSQWCRCRDTAELLDLAPVEDFPPLNSFYADRSTAQRQTRKTRQFLADMPDDERVVLVTHQVNITALTDQFPSSGEVFVLRMTDAGEVTVKGSVLIRP